MRIGIVGGGPAGIISAIAVAKVAQAQGRRITIDIFDPGAPFRGRSFNTFSSHMLLNTSIGVSALDPDNPAGFVDYLCKEEGLSVTEGDVVPRDAASRYLEVEFDKVKNGHVELTIVPARVDDVSLDGCARAWFHSTVGSQAYDAAILATGLEFRRLPDYFAIGEVISPYPSRQLAQVNPDDSVLVVGTRLAAVDALVCLAAQGHRGSISVHSRSGIFPGVRRSVIKPTNRPFLNEFLGYGRDAEKPVSTFAMFLELLERHISAAGMRLTDFVPSGQICGAAQLNQDIRLCETRENVWEGLMMDVIDGLNLIWPRLPDSEKLRFRGEADWLGRLAHSMPLRNARIIQRMFSSGQLRSVSAEEAQSTSQQIRWVVNTTGLCSANEDPLLMRVAEKSLLRFNESGGVAVEAGSLRTRADLSIYANGSVIHGEVFTANSVYSTAQGAQHIARDLLGGGRVGATVSSSSELIAHTSSSGSRIEPVV
ncbi:FAD/NAD(P)-binding protein [Ensifer adhaerens]